MAKKVKSIETKTVESKPACYSAECYHDTVTLILDDPEGKSSFAQNLTIEEAKNFAMNILSSIAVYENKGEV